jgi:hypothetical protein
VTNNVFEFRGRHRNIELHPGIVFLLPAVRRAVQIRLFEAALEHVRQHQTDLVNMALDVGFDEQDTPTVSVYRQPTTGNRLPTTDYRSAPRTRMRRAQPVQPIATQVGGRWPWPSPISANGAQ